MSKEIFFIGAPLVFQKGITIYPPTVRDVVTNDNYSIYVRLLTYSQEEVEDDFVEAKKTLDKYPTPLEYLLNNSYHNKQYEALCKEAFRFFIKEEVFFLYEQKAIVVGKLSEFLSSLEALESISLLNEENFFDFQNAIRESVGKKKVEPPNPNEHPKIKAMKAKARYRDKIKAKQNKGISLYTSLVSICCMGLGITPLNIGEMSYTAIEALMNMYQDKEKYHLDIDTLLAGGDSKKINPKYWIRNFED